MDSNKNQETLQDEYFHLNAYILDELNKGNYLDKTLLLRESDLNKILLRRESDLSKILLHREKNLEQYSRRVDYQLRNY